MYASATRVVLTEVNNVFTIPTWTMDDDDPYLVRCGRVNFLTILYFETWCLGLGF